MIDKDTYITANLIIEQYGKEASTHALERMKEFIEKGEHEGVQVWAKIMHAIHILTDSEQYRYIN